MLTQSTATRNAENKTRLGHKVKKGKGYKSYD